MSSTQLPGGQKKSPSDTDDLIRRVAELDEELQSRLTREIAVLFTDIRGSTTFFKIHGDIAGRLMMQRHYDMLFPIIEESKGSVVKTVGDSIMATFDDPETAVKAAIAMQRKLFSYNATKPHEDPIRIRIGINFGKGIIEENDVFGDVVNVASKLVSVGESEQIVVGESI
ncbi:MAG: adenylate/guanylate cyclase domain-containing protein, partial [Thermodesulfobacteriota bacterium]|nr:adenylate/guanylate cyclase domain-containing protein [Thermodesulfobacteriota bacterium]